jgi:NAD(P)-dependent dehydrogenase (short-subunit alcohol dehydrogenase family)
MLTGKTALVTGSTGGIGRPIAAGLADLGANVIVVGRDRIRGESLVAEIHQKTGREAALFLPADLSSQDEVRRLANEVMARYPKLDLLVNNVGGLYAKRWETVDGIEGTLAVNVLAPFLLTNLLVPSLTAAAPARIVNLTSSSHRFARLRLDDLQATTWYRAMDAYTQAKLAGLLLTYAWARHLAGTGVAVNAADPGGADTDMVRSMTWDMMGWSWRIMWTALRLTGQFVAPEKAAQSAIFVATSPTIEGVTGAYFGPRRRPIRSSPVSYDEELGSHLWNACNSLVGLRG